MSKIRLGDLIKYNNSLDYTVYIVIDVMEFENRYDNGDLYSEIEYGVMQINPVQMHSKYSTINHNECCLLYRDGSELAEYFHRNTVKINRANRGFIGVPDFVKTLNTSMKSRDVYLVEGVKWHNENRELITVKNIGEKRERIKIPFREERKDISAKDRSKPFPMSTIDECLDAMNGADLLYNMLGDDKYLKMKDKALAKLVELTS